MVNELQKPVFWRALSQALSAYEGPRHPYLAQGMLFGHWRPENPPKPFTKNYEIGKQIGNLGRYFPATWTDPASVPAILTTIAERQADAERLADSTVRSLSATVDDRLLIGTGLPNQLETGLLLHPLYGVPYIPASTIKGITQAHLLTGWAAEAGLGRLRLEQHQDIVQKEPKKTTPLQAFEHLLYASVVRDDVWELALDDVKRSLRDWGGTEAQVNSLTEWGGEQGRERGKLFVRLFGAPARPYRGKRAGEGRQQPGSAPGGSTVPTKTAWVQHRGSRGLVTYLDAFPTKLKMAAAGQTPHGGAYYEAARQLLQPKKPGVPPSPKPPPPDDHFDPVPFQYPAVVNDSTFLVTVAAKDADLADAAREAVKRALTHDGLGAKRGIGFGRFQVS